MSRSWVPGREAQNDTEDRMIVTAEKLERWKLADPKTLAVAKAMFVVKSSSRDPSLAWDELVCMPEQQITVAHYVELAEVAITTLAEFNS